MESEEREKKKRIEKRQTNMCTVYGNERGNEGSKEKKTQKKIIYKSRHTHNLCDSKKEYGMET